MAPPDAGALHALWTAPGVRLFLWDDEIVPMSRTTDAIEQSGRLFAERGAGLWGAWLLDAPSRLAGFGGLWPFRDPPDFELLYGVAEPLWGRGFACELAAAIVEYCEGPPLHMATIRASTDAANVASVRVLETLDFAFVRRATVDGLDTVFYERRREPRAHRRPADEA